MTNVYDKVHELAKVLKDVALTIGQNETTIVHLQKLGAGHIKTNSAEVVIDRTNKIVSTACYMLDVDISQIALSADKMIKTMLDLID